MPTQTQPAPNPPNADVFSQFGGHADPAPQSQPSPDIFAQFGGKSDSSPAGDVFAQFGGKSDAAPQSAPQPAAQPAPAPSTWDRIKNVWHTATTVPIPELVGRMFGPKGEAAAKLSESSSIENLGLGLDTAAGQKLAQSKNRVVSTLGRGLEAISNFERGGLESSTTPVGAVAAISGAEPLQEAAPVLGAVSKGVNAAFGAQGLFTLGTPKKPNETTAQYIKRLGSGALQTGVALLAHHAATREPVPSVVVAESEPAKVAAEQAQTVFHGTPANVSSIEELSAEHAKPQATAGPGIYLTPDPNVASNYVQSTEGGRVLAGKLSPDAKLLDANAPLPDAVLKSQGLPKGTTYHDALNSIREEKGLENGATDIKRLQVSVARAGYSGVDNLYPDRKALMIFPDAMLPAGRKYQDLVTAALPTARVVSPDYVPVVSKDDVLAETTQRIVDNSNELQKAGVDASAIQTNADVGRALTLASAHIARNADPRVLATISLPAQRELASDLGMSLDDLLARRSGQAFNAEQAIAARSLLRASATDMLNKARLANMGDEDYLNQFRASLARHQEIQNQVAGVRAEAGRALGSFRAPEVETQLANAMSGLKGPALTKAAQLLSKVDPADSRQLNEFIQQITPSSTADKIFEYYRNALLSSPHTAILKGVSENLMMALETSKKLVGGTIAQLKGDPDALASDAYWYAKGAIRAIPKAVKYAMPGKFDLQDAPDFERTGTQAVKGPLGKVVRAPQTVLSRQTNAMFMLNYFGELESQAARQAAREGLAGDELAARQEYLVNNPTPAMRDAANDVALHNTFQHRLGSFGAGVQRTIQRPTIELFGQQVPNPARYVFPFFKTPINIVKESGNYSPYGFVKGTLTGDADLQAKGLVGSSILAGIAHLVADGKITGGGPLDYSHRQTLEDTGWKPYSIKVGGKYISYHRAEPVGLLAGLVADAVHSQNIGDDPETVQAKTDTAYNFALRNVDDLPFMMQLSDLLGTIDAHGNSERRISDFLDREVAGFIPAAVGNVAQAEDSTIRRPQNLTQTLAQKIPGLTKNVPPVLDIEGNPVKAPASRLGGMNPFPVSSANGDAVINELARLGVPTPAMPKTLKVRGQTIPLTPDQSTELYQRERRAITKQLSALIASPAYQQLSDDERRVLIQRMTERVDTASKGATLGDLAAHHLLKEK